MKCIICGQKSEKGKRVCEECDADGYLEELREAASKLNDIDCKSE